MLGSKISNLLLAEKNLVDFVDKNLGQEKDRLSQNELELDTVCHHLVGGILDYPAAISHDFCDITTAWDIYIEFFTKTTAAAIPSKFGQGIYERKPDKNERMLKMPFRGDELSQKQFVNAIAHAGSKIRNHIVECTEECIQSGRLENLYVIISNVVMIRNYFWVFQEIFDLEPKSKLKAEYKEICDLVEVISEQMLQCHANLLTTYILHDENSQNWSSYQAYYEGQRGSPTIPMWAFFLRGVQKDMWRILPPLLSQRILSILVNDSLGILTVRYSQINPTHITRHQFLCDIVNILATVEELLFYISADLTFVYGESDPSASKIIFSIHVKCHCLITSLILVGCPLEVLYKTFRRGRSTCPLMEKVGRHASGLTRPVWMKILQSLCSKYFPDSFFEWKLLHHLKLLRCQPAPNWALVYKVLTMNDRKFATFILTLFPTVIAPSMDFLLEGKSFKRCGYAACMSPNCHSLAKSLANHHVSTCVLYILGHTLPREFFADAYRPVLATISDWSVMDKTQVWTSASRPVWFQSLVDLLLPILKTCVQSVCLNVASNPAKFTTPLQEQGDDSTLLVIELLNNLTELLSMIPRGFFLVCEEMDDMIPPLFHPVRNNVPIHFLVTALYMLLNLGSKIIVTAENIFISAMSRNVTIGTEEVRTEGGTAGEAHPDNSPPVFPSKELEPILLSISERLCHLEDTAFDQVIHRLVSQIESMMRQTQTQLAKKKLASAKTDFFMTSDIASLKADFLLQEVEGQLALRVAYWFLITHGDMLEDIIINGFANQEKIASVEKNTSEDTTSCPEVGTVFKKELGNDIQSRAHGALYNKVNMKNLKIAPRIRTYVKPLNIVHEFHYVNRNRTFDEIIWSGEDMDWVNTVRGSKLGLQRSMILKQLERRWEFQPDYPEEASHSSNTTTSAKDPSTCNSVHVNKMVEEIRALMTTI